MQKYKKNWKNLFFNITLTFCTLILFMSNTWVNKKNVNTLHGDVHIL